jgi:hypothetical protein
MTASGLCPRNLALLKDPALDLPKVRAAGGDFEDFLDETYAAFFERLEAFEGSLASLIRARNDRMRALAAALVSAWPLGRKGDWAAADAQLAAGVRCVRKELIRLSRRHSARILLGQSWYRLAAWKGVESRRHMFHTPFERPQKSYRFSTPGAPALYLANSVYLCWLECGEPRADDCFVSRFEVNPNGFEFLDLPCNHQAYVAPLDFPDVPGLEVDPRRVMNSPYVDDVLTELADYLAGWPIFAAVAVRKPEPAPESPDEYVISQLLMRWTQASDSFLGIRYFTSKHDPSTNSQDWSVNLALPARTKKDSGYCDFLRARVQCTIPQRLSSMHEKSVRDLITREAGDRRQQAMGRYMLRWPDGRLEEYSGTLFGKMEYWLDRPELQLAPIEADPA